MTIKYIIFILKYYTNNCMDSWMGVSLYPITQNSLSKSIALIELQELLVLLHSYCVFKKSVVISSVSGLALSWMRTTFSIVAAYRMTTGYRTGSVSVYLSSMYSSSKNNEVSLPLSAYSSPDYQASTSKRILLLDVQSISNPSFTCFFPNSEMTINSSQVDCTCQ